MNKKMQHWALAIRKPGSEYDESYGLAFDATVKDAKQKYAKELEWVKAYRPEFVDTLVLLKTTEFRSEPIHYIRFGCY